MTAAELLPVIDSDAVYTLLLAVGAAVAVVAYIILLGVIALPEKRK